MLLDIEDGSITPTAEEEKYLVNKTDWVKWMEMTEVKFSEWNENHCIEDIETMYDSFYEVFELCMNECVPKKVINLSNKK